MFEFTIEGELPALNEIIAASKSHYGQYSTMKRKNNEIILLCIKKSLKTNIEPLNEKVDVTINWYTKNERKDPDNIAGGGQKVILDALVHAGVLVNDTRKFIGNIHHYFATDKDKPRIEVKLTKHA